MLFMSADEAAIFWVVIGGVIVTVITCLSIVGSLFDNDLLHNLSSELVSTDSSDGNVA